LSSLTDAFHDVLQGVNGQPLVEWDTDGLAALVLAFCLAAKIHLRLVCSKQNRRKLRLLEQKLG